MPKQKLPKPYSVSVLAHFWDEHDVTDFEDSLEEVTESVFSKVRDIRVQLEQDEVESLEKMARQRGLKNDDLIREWIIEKIHAA